MREGQAKVAAQALAHVPVRAMFEGGMCMFGYYSRLPYLAEMSGLTQYSLAKKPLAARGEPAGPATGAETRGRDLLRGHAQGENLDLRGRRHGPAAEQSRGAVRAH